MAHITLTQVALLLLAAAVAAPLGKLLRVGAVLGYLIAGVLLGPFGIGQVFSIYAAEEILHIGEFGVVLLLFLIGLELRPKRLWTLRSSIFGLGGAQVAATAVVLAVIGSALGLAVAAALFVGLALSLSSTAFALQVLEEKGELTTRHGRLAFAVLLFQDLAAIPLIALVPLFAISAVNAAPAMDVMAAVQALATIAGVVIVGRFALDHVFRLVARAGVKEAMTATALLVVLGSAIVMTKAGLSPSLGAFLAGALLAESSYRHQLEADIQPFEGLLLGLFFVAIGMSLNLKLMVDQPGLILALVLGLVAVKAAVLYGLGRWRGLDAAGGRRLAFSISQGGEFAFVLLKAGAAAGVLASQNAELIAVVVTLSMAVTPALLLADEWVARMTAPAAPPYETPPENDGHVIIAGFGRVGQIAGRILRAKGIAFTALDANADQIDFVRRFGSQVFYGDASRADILEAARADKARAVVLAIDDVEASLRTAERIRARYPNLPIHARARNRSHAHKLMDLGVTTLHRETFLSSLALAGDVLRGLGQSEREVQRTLSTFKAHDEKRLIDDYKMYTDIEKLQEKARGDAENLEKLFREDTEAAIVAGAREPAQV